MPLHVIDFVGCGGYRPASENLLRIRWEKVVIGKFAWRPVRLLALIGAGSLIAACADRRGGVLPYDKQLGAPDAQHFETLGEDYKIAPMDTLTIKVFRMDDLSGDYSVDLAGHLSMPLIGVIPVRWTGPDFAVVNDDPLTEELEVAHHGFRSSNASG